LTAKVILRRARHPPEILRCAGGLCASAAQVIKRYISPSSLRAYFIYGRLTAMVRPFFLRRIGRTYRHVVRLRRILDVLLAEGFGFVVVRMKLHKLIRLPKRLRRYLAAAPTPITFPQQIRRVVEELGPTFIKFGQMLAARPDILPAAYVREFGQLQDHVAPLPFNEIRPVLEVELGRPPEEALASFNAEPVASASLAQVYGAVLSGGEAVVVKVQRPGIRETVRTDLEILSQLAVIVEERFPELRPIQPRELVDEFAVTIKRELDFSSEAGNTDRLRKNLESFDGARAPRVFWEYTTDRLLVVERLEGIRADDVGAIEDAGLERAVLARRLVECFMKQVFVDGFYHADPHPGNILIAPQGEILLLDCGAVGYLTAEYLNSLGALLLAFNDGDYERVATDVLRLGGADELLDISRFKNDAAAVVGRYYAMPLRYMRIGTMLEEITVLASRNGVRLPRELILLAKTVVLIENLARTLDPELRLLYIAAPFARDLVKKHYAPLTLAKGFADGVADLNYYLGDVPRDVNILIKKLLRGKIRLGLEHLGLSDAVEELDRSTNRLSFAVVVASIIIGSAWVFAAGVGPQVYGYPVLGVIGFVLAAFLGLGLAFAMFRSGRF
jgi:ubiquinone biosynthesis protein